MATIVNTPPAQNTGESGNGMGTIFGIIAILILLAVLIFYGLPAFRQSTGGNTGGTTNNNAPTYQAPEGGAQGGTDVNIPDKIDVNVNPNGGNNNQDGNTGGQ